MTSEFIARAGTTTGPVTMLEQPLGSLEGLEPPQGCTSSLGRNLYHFLITILGTATGPVAGVTAELIMRGGVTEGSAQSLEQLQDV